MKQIAALTYSVAILLVSAFTMLQLTSWKVKENYTVKCNDISFKGLKARIEFDEAHPERSKIRASIDATTLNTGNSEKNAHAKEPGALNTAKYPLISFVSASVKKTVSGYEAVGNLTLKGITREIRIPFIFNSKKMSDKFPFIDKETFSGTITIAPRDFNMTRPGTPETIVVELTVPVTR